MIPCIALDFVMAFKRNGSPIVINNDENKIPANEKEFIEDLKLPSDCQL